MLTPSRVRSRLLSICLVALLIQQAKVVDGDAYLNNPRGSNNKLNEQQNNRNNANRLFDSQNNGNAGYQVCEEGKDVVDRRFTNLIRELCWLETFAAPSSLPDCNRRLVISATVSAKMTMATTTRPCLEQERESCTSIQVLVVCGT
jgi:hypothetical protein